MTKSSQPQNKFLVESQGPDIQATPADVLHSRKNKYLMVNVLGRRARELNRGERALVDLPEPHTMDELAVAEVESNRLSLVRRQKSKVLVNLIKNE
jgi:DNA-directed RNA polymerase subunit K/omega